MSAKKYRIRLTAEERTELKGLVSKGRAAAHKQTHARILLMCDEARQGGPTRDEEIASALTVGTSTVARVRRRCVEEGLEPALNRRRQLNWRPRVLDGEAEARLLAIACGAPGGADEVDAAPAGRSAGGVRDRGRHQPRDGSRDAKKNDLKPWLKECWCIPPKENAEFVCAMEDVLDVYHRDYGEDEVLVCMDETAGKQVKETRVPRPARPGEAAVYDYEYERNGTSNLFMLFAPLEGRRRVEVTARRTKVDWAHLIRELVDGDYPDKRVVLVMDNLNTHTPASLYEAFEPVEARRIAQRLEIHYTPKHGSWLNMAEIEIGAMVRQCVDRRIPDRDSMRREVEAWQQRRNRESVRVDWRFTTADARIKLKTLYPSIQGG